MKKIIAVFLVFAGLVMSCAVNANDTLPAYFNVNLKDARYVVLAQTAFDKEDMFVFIDKEKPECKYLGKMTGQGNISVFEQKCRDQVKTIDYFAFERDYNKNPRFFPARVGTSYLLISRQAIKERAPTQLEKSLKSYKGALNEASK